ncbi:alpha/beta fold hydrolase [Nocardioides pyridinolyticus]
MSRPSTPSSRFYTNGELRLHYLEWNSAAADTVVLVHGINVQAHTWDPIAEQLAAHRRVIALDLRGHGLSDWAPDGYNISSFVADLDALLHHLGLLRVDLVGHSLGARVCIAYAGEHPDLVNRLVLSDTGPEVAAQGGAFSRDIVASTHDVRGFRDQEAARAHYERLHPEWQSVFIDLHVEHQLRRNWAGKLVFRADPDLFWITGSAGRRENAYLWKMCEHITAPTLIMWGTRSPFLDESIASRMLQALPDGHLARIEAGHYIPREVPDEFTRTLLEFLETPLPPTPKEEGHDHEH